MSGSPGAGPTRALSDAAQRVQDAIAALGFANRVIELSEPVKTSQAAAGAVGCTVAQIVKSLVFLVTAGEREGAPLLVLASGADRIDVARLAALVGAEVTMADPKFVRAVTGFAIGGIPPLGHAQPIEVLIERRLLAQPALWAAAGHPNSLFPLTPQELVAMTNGRVAEMAL